ncbi:MAG: D-alanine--D-alanine ligase [Marinilabiliaceae bacterium]|nr:D-alanine--D-alanine ligase [Marinilabiliaceae bacterium]
MNVALVYGGYTSEAGVSARSKDGLMKMMDRKKHNIVPVNITTTSWIAEPEGEAMQPINRDDFSYINEKGEKIEFACAYITIHGNPGENGQLGGYFEMIGMPYSTCPSITSAMTYDKFICNTFLRGLGVNLAKSIMVESVNQMEASDIVREVGLPCFIKPAAGGSSFGVTKVKSENEIVPAIQKALNESPWVLIESLLTGTEVTCGLYKTKRGTVIFPLTEVVSENEFFDYEAKYTPGKAQEITPARVSDEVRDKVWATASRIYDLMHMRGIVRIDFIIREDGEPFMLEVNTTPGMTLTSFIPQQIKAAGMKTEDVFNDVIDELVSDK